MFWYSAPTRLNNDLLSVGVILEKGQQGDQYGHPHILHFSVLEKIYAKVSLLGSAEVDDGTVYARVSVEA